MLRSVRPALKQHLKGAALCMGLGLLASVLTAWTVAGLSNIPMYPRDTIRVFAADDRAYHAVEVHQFGTIDIWWSLIDEEPGTASERAAKALEKARQPIPGRPERRVTASPASWGSLRHPDPLLPRIGSDTAFGWPMPCLWYQVTGELSRNGAGDLQVGGDQLHGGILLKGELSSRGRSFRALPFRPVPLGLAADALAVAVLFWLLLFGRPRLRAHLRRRRGLCPSCGYDVRGAAGTCPECGAAAP
jgi:hypothetical protein